MGLSTIFLRKYVPSFCFCALLFFLSGGCVCGEEHAAPSHEEKKSGEAQDLKQDLRGFCEAHPVSVTYIDEKTLKPKEFIIIAYAPRIEDKEVVKKFKLWQHRLHDSILLATTAYLRVIWQGRGAIDEGELEKLYTKIFLKVFSKEELKEIRIFSVLRAKAA